jgi:hypothetical protein
MTDATWTGTTGDYSDSSNWNPSGPPSNGETATFGDAGQHTVTVNAVTEVGTWSFSGTDPYTFTLTGVGQSVFDGQGIVTNGVDVSINVVLTSIQFRNNSTAGGATITLDGSQIFVNAASLVKTDFFL